MQSTLLVIFADELRGVSADKVGGLVGESEPHVVREGILAAKDVLGARHTPPKYIVIDIGARGADTLQELDALAQACEPGIRVVVAGQVNDVSFYRNLIQRGIVEYFAYPVDAGQMADALMGAPTIVPSRTSSGRHAPQKSGMAIGFMSAASGDGASTTALNTAYLLANQFNSSVALVDLDYQFGMIARHLDLKAPYGIRELLEYPERGVDTALLNKMLVPYGKNLKIVAAPNDLRKLPEVRTEQIVELLTVLKSQFDFVLFDVQHIWVQWVASLLSKMDHNVLVAQLWLRSLTHVTRILAAWQQQGISQNHVSLVVNRSGSKLKEAMTVEDFEQIAGVKINFSLSNDTKSIVAGESQGKTITELGDSQLARQMQLVARHIHGLYTGDDASVSADGQKKGILGGLLGKKA